MTMIRSFDLIWHLIWLFQVCGLFLSLVFVFCPPTCFYCEVKLDPEQIHYLTKINYIFGQDTMGVCDLENNVLYVFLNIDSKGLFAMWMFRFVALSCVARVSCQCKFLDKEFV